MSSEPSEIPSCAPTEEPPQGSAGWDRKPRRGDVLEVEIEGYAAGGGLRAAHCDQTGEYRVELRRGIPGARVRAQVVARRGHDLRARLGDVLRVSPNAVAPRCAHVPDCGGCSHQDLDYARQLDEKRKVAVRVLAGHGLLGRPGAPQVEACIGCDHEIAVLRWGAGRFQMGTSFFNRSMNSSIKARASARRLAAARAWGYFSCYFHYSIKIESVKSVF